MQRLFRNHDFLTWSRPSWRRRLALVALATSLVSLSVVAFADGLAGAVPSTLYVSATGLDAGGCDSPASPCATISYALTQVSTDVAIEINGTINDNVVTSGNVTLSGADLSFTTSPAVIDGDQNGTTVTVFNPGSVTMDDLEVTGGSQGGIYDGGVVDLYASTVEDNSSIGDSGGGILSNGVLNLTDSTVAGNSAFNGGGIFSYSSGNEGTLLDSTIADNVATAGNASFGGGLWSQNGQFSVGGTLFADNGADGNCATVETLPTDLGYNLSDDASCGFSSLDGDVLSATTLSPLGLYGGTTPTIVPDPSGPAVGAIPASDTQLCSRKDQRAFPRPGLGQVNCTIGAAEMNALSPSLDLASVTVATGSDVTYEASVYAPTGAVAPTGTVSFVDGTTPITCASGDQTLVGAFGASSASCTVNYSSSVGSPHSITALYVPDTPTYAAGVASTPEVVTITSAPSAPVTTTTVPPLLAQATLSLTSTKGVVGHGLTLTTSGGTGTGGVTYAARGGTAKGCAVTNGVLSVTRAGTCEVAATKASDGTYAATSSSATPVAFANPPRPGVVTVSFVKGTSTLRAGARSALAKLAKSLIGGARLSIRGYASENRPLARARARAVANFLRTRVSLHWSFATVNSSRHVVVVRTLSQ